MAAVGVGLEGFRIYLAWTADHRVGLASVIFTGVARTLFLGVAVFVLDRPTSRAACSDQYASARAMTATYPPMDQRVQLFGLLSLQGAYALFVAVISYGLLVNEGR